MNIQREQGEQESGEQKSAPKDAETRHRESAKGNPDKEAEHEAKAGLAMAVEVGLKDPVSKAQAMHNIWNTAKTEEALAKAIAAAAKKDPIVARFMQLLAPQKKAGPATKGGK